MKSNISKLFYVIFVLAAFTYGLIAGVYKIFPEPQIRDLKNYLEDPHTYGSVTVYNSSLQRLLIKKNQLPGSIEQSGALSVSDNILFIISKKGTIQPYDLDKYVLIDNNISDVPMNLEDLYNSGLPDDDFNIDWFRVNGSHIEEIDNNTYELYVSHNGYDEGENCITHNLSRIKLTFNADSISQVGVWETIYSAAPCIDPEPKKIAAAKPYPGHISGGPIIDFDDSRLLVAVGDYNRHGIGEIQEWAMNPSNPYGKTILVNKKSGEWSVFSMGNRNITGLLKDENDTIWAVENGPKGGDELNMLAKGNNYGWPKVSYGLWYDHSFELIGKHTAGTHPEFVKPVHSWLPSVAPRGLTKIMGDKFKYWHGDLLMGTMKDESLHRLRLGQNNRVIYDERIELGHRIRDMVSLQDGKIALITDDNLLIIIDDGGAAFLEIRPEIEQRIDELQKFESVSEGRNRTLNRELNMSSQLIFQKKCSSCHNLNPVNGIGPHLSNLYNREIGEVEGYNPSQTLKSDTRTWNARLLRSFLEEPDNEFQGTRMQKVNLTSAQIDSLVQFFDTK